MDRETTAPVGLGIQRHGGLGLVGAAHRRHRSFAPSRAGPADRHGIDKALHPVGYFFLAVLPFAGFGRR